MYVILRHLNKNAVNCNNKFNYNNISDQFSHYTEKNSFSNFNNELNKL